jgi:DNA-binding PadR family transcriptional regulator
MMNDEWRMLNAPCSLNIQHATFSIHHYIDLYYIDQYNQPWMPSDSSLKPHWFYILLALSHGDRHGLAIARDVESLSDGRVRLWPATLYGSLDALRARRWIEELSDPRERPEAESERKRYYRLTRSGRQTLTTEADHLGRVARLARSRVRPRTGETG